MAGALLAACSSGADSTATELLGSESLKQTDSSTSQGTCDFCTLQLGGETNDYDGGDELACGFVTTRTLVVVGEEPAPFDLRATLDRMQRSIEADAQFEASSQQNAGIRASGYSEETRMFAAVTPTASYLIDLDPEHCPAGVCPHPSWGSPEELCEFQPTLEVEFNVTIRTADEAIQATGAGIAIDYADPAGLRGFAEFDLATNEGALVLSEPEVEGPYYATLRTEFLFGPEETEGSMWFEVLAGGPNVQDDYMPLIGRWPSRRGTLGEPQPVMSPIDAP